MAPPQQAFVAVIGVGGVGKCFLSQLSQLAQRMSQNPGQPMYLSLILLASSKKALISPNYHHLNLSTCVADLQASTNSPMSPADITEYLTKAPERVVLVDNTSSEDIAKEYPSLLSKGVSIVTPNKKAFSSDLGLWKDIFSTSSNGTGSGGWIFHESSCCAGLPIISTLKELVETGDDVLRIEGVFSGTMSFLLNSFMPVSGGGAKFSDVVKRAKELGYTEPDPRDDLNGMDVARKLTILARMVGLQVENATSFPVQSLIPKELEGCQSADEFLQKLPEFDAEMEKRKEEAAKEGKVVRFVGSINVAEKQLRVGLEKFDQSHPIAALKGSDNIVSFHTKRYGENPLIVQGAGAGGDVTAMGVSGDLIKVLRLLHVQERRMSSVIG